MKTFFASSKASLLLLLMTVASTGVAQRYAGALSPEESLKKMQLLEGFKAEIFATEPQVLDPVAMEFDEAGNAYVVELYDYPFEAERDKGQGRIRLLQDTNGDGRIDKSSVFADKLTEATTILPYKGGLIVTAAPYILYLKDTNGDGKADTRETLFSGFFEGNSEAQITSLRYGIDNWIYANNNGQNGQITFSRKPGEPAMSVAGADFRFRLDRNQFELETGPGQFGQTINDWGHRFFTANSIHLQQVVVPWRYIHRHAYLPSTKGVVSITDHQEIMFQETAPPYWRAERTRQRNKMYQENNMKRVEYAEDRFTGASGGTIYAADGFPKEFYGNIFTTDVSGNLVHRDLLKPSDKGPFHVASRGTKEQDKEFLTSTDTWFRPTNFTVGPDGYLYVLDYYRQHIETPVSIPDELKADMDFMAGSDKGRIYRILPAKASSKKVSVNLKTMSAANLVEVLSKPNLWWRQQAQRLLVERQDKSVVPALQAVVAKGSDPRARLHALYTLEGLNALNETLVRQALKDSSPGVRENALMLAERYPATLTLVIEKLQDPSRRVAFQASLSLGEFKGREVLPALAQVVSQYGQDPWFRMAVLSSEAGSSPALLQQLLGQKSFFQVAADWKIAFVEELSNVIGARNQKEQVSAYLNLLPRQEAVWQAPAMTGLTTGLKRSASADAKLKETLQGIKTSSAQEVSAALNDLKKLY